MTNKSFYLLQMLYEEFLSQCNALIAMEQQAKRFHRDVLPNPGGNYIRFEEAYWPCTVNQQLYERLYLLIQKHHILVEKSKEEWMSQCERFIQLCRIEPIPAAFIGVLLTLFILNETASESPVARMKGLKKISAQDRKIIQPLYEDVKHCLQKHAKNNPSDMMAELPAWKKRIVATVNLRATEGILPVVDWAHVMDDFCTYHQVPMEERELVRQYIEEGRTQHTPTKKMRQCIAHLPCYNELEGVMNLFNLNNCMRLTAGKNVLQIKGNWLEDYGRGKLLPLSEKGNLKGMEDPSLVEIYYEALAKYSRNANLSELALARYTYGTQDYDGFIRIPFFKYLFQEYDGNSALVVNSMRCEYADKLFKHRKVEIEATKDIRLKKILRTIQGRVVDALTEDRYYRLVTDSDWVEYPCAVQVIDDFLKDENILGDMKIRDTDMEHLRYEVYSEILDYIQFRLRQDFIGLWESFCSETLYSKKEFHARDFRLVDICAEQDKEYYQKWRNMC